MEDPRVGVDGVVPNGSQARHPQPWYGDETWRLRGTLNGTGEGVLDAGNRGGGRGWGSWVRSRSCAPRSLGEDGLRVECVVRGSLGQSASVGLL